MGNDDTRTFYFGQTLGDDMLADIVECRGSLVEEENPRLSHQCPGDEDALPLSARYALAIHADGCLHAQGQLLDVLVECCHSGGLPGIFLRQRRIVEDNVIEDGALDESAILQTDTDAETTEAGQVDLTEVILVIEDRPSLRMLQAKHQSHKRTLAAARGTDECHIVATVDMQVKTVEEQRYIMVIAEFQAADIDRTCHILHHDTAVLGFRLSRHDRSAEL